MSKNHNHIPPTQPQQQPQQQAEQPAEKPARQATEEPATNAQPQNDEKPAEATDAGDAPVFKVQLLASDRKLKANDRQLKGVSGVDSYKEGGLWKYTVGASPEYSDIKKLKSQLAEKFPQAFIVAFRGTEKIPVAEALKELKK
jgi:N-acetylmuramoyl-L-alanine amidase